MEDETLVPSETPPVTQALAPPTTGVKTTPRPPASDPRATNARTTNPPLVGATRLRARRARQIRRMLRDGQRKPPRRWRLILALALIHLTAILVPAALAYNSVMADYSSLRALGESGLRHLLNAKDDLGSLSSLGQVLRGATPATPAVGPAPYTLLVQRQPGTFYTAQVTIQPAPKMKSSGISPASYNVTVGQNTPLTIGAKPAPKPSSTPTPTATPAPGSAGAATSLIPGPQQVQAAQAECLAAQKDFLALQARLVHLGWAVSGASRLPIVGDKLETAHALADIGYDAATLGAQLAGAAIPLLTRLHGASLTGNSDLLTQADITTLQKAITQAQPLFTALETKLAEVQVDDLPVSAAQKAQFAQVKGELPKLQTGLSQATQWIGMVGWLVGTDAPRHFLVQTLDRTELRANGGFAGDFGILSIQNGKIGPFSLVPVARTSYPGFRWYDGWNGGRRPPAAYSWWPIANWGLRDANLSPDFPITATQLVIPAFRGECGAACQAEGVPANVDGLINISPVAIEHILTLTGPLVIPEYGETITADNLEYKLHYYSLQHADGSPPPSTPDNPTGDRKAFLYLLGHLLEDRLRHLPQAELVPVARQLLADVESKDLQIYVTNTTAEDLLVKQHLAGAVDTTSGQDSFFVVQQNVSAAKANPCVDVAQQDAVTLDDKGGATHHLTIAMHHIIGACDPWFAEFSTYHAYMRVYVPPQAQLLGADGFDSNQPLCAANCSPNPYPNGELVCQPGGYAPGVHTNNILPMGAEAGVLDQLGGPTQTTSDVPGRAMWGGFVVIPPFCTANLTLSWYVPHVVR